MMKNSSPLRGKPSTGEPDAGEPHVRYGGRGDANQCVVPTPIGGIRPSAPQVNHTRVPDTYGGPFVDNPYMEQLLDAVEIQEHNHFYLSYNFRRKAADDAPSEENLASWIHLNARSHDVLRNAETEGSPFGWHTQLLSQKETAKTVISKRGYAKWGNSFGYRGKARIAMVDIPRQPMHSLVELTHANLASYNMAPTFALGNSYVSPFIPPDQSYATQGQHNLSPSTDQKFRQEQGAKKFFHRFNYTLPDASYQLNKAIFDRYFFSTIPDGSKAAEEQDYRNVQFDPRVFPPFQDFNQEFVNRYYNPENENRKKYLIPNPRMRYYSEDGSPPKIEDLHDMDSAAAHLLVDGAFNVNSTSIKAWENLLKTVKGASFRHTMGQFQDAEKTAILRSVYPYWGSNDIWQGFQKLSDQQINQLAEAIVDEVKKRGPFRSLAEFMNRSLERPKDLPEQGHQPWLSGPIQTALDNTVNQPKFKEPKYGPVADFQPTAGSHWKQSKGTGTDSDSTNFFSENKGNHPISAGIPGWVQQSDLLRPIAPILNARSDTFTIRGYGEINSNGNTRAKAICEMVVQRVPEYINNHVSHKGAKFLMHYKEQETWYAPDPQLEAAPKDLNLELTDDSTAFPNKKLALQENFRLGRRYKVVQFRWL